jgi:hypothetical protein
MPGEEKFAKTRRDVWYITRSYVVRRDDADQLFAWAKDQDFMGRWMPDPTEFRHVFLREIPTSVAYSDEYGAANEDRWCLISDKQNKSTNFQVMRTTEEYIWEGTGFDCSVNEGVRVNLPARELMEGMELTHGVSPGRFEDSNGDVVALDPSVAENGPQVLLVKKASLLRFLREKNYELISIVMGEKLLIGDLGGGRGFPGRREMGGALRMRANGQLEGSTYTKVLPPRPA